MFDPTGLQGVVLTPSPVELLIRIQPATNTSTPRANFSPAVNPGPIVVGPSGALVPTPNPSSPSTPSKPSLDIQGGHVDPQILDQGNRPQSTPQNAPKPQPQPKATPQPTQNEPVDSSREQSDANIYYNYTKEPIPPGQGLLPENYVTTEGTLSGQEAALQLGIGVPFWVHPVIISDPDNQLWPVNTPGPAPGWEVPGGTPPGTVLPPQPVPFSHDESESEENE